MKLDQSMEKSAGMWKAIEAVIKLEELRVNPHVHFVSIELEITKDFYEIQIWPERKSPYWQDNSYGESGAYTACGSTLSEAVGKAWAIVNGWDTKLEGKNGNTG